MDPGPANTGLYSVENVTDHYVAQNPEYRDRYEAQRYLDIVAEYCSAVMLRWRAA